MPFSTRAASSVLGVALLLTVTVATMVAVIAFGTLALDDTREEVGTSRAEQSLTQLDSQTAMVALGRTERQSVPLSSGSGDFQVRDRKGWLKVTIENTTSGETKTLLNESLGAVVHERGDAELAYQGGGVWKKTDAGVTMVSPPEVHYRNGTLTLPIISMNGSGNHTLDGGVTVEKSETTRHEFPNKTADENFTNPLKNGKVTITVHSEYYEGWGEYFETRTDGTVNYDDERETASITLKVPTGERIVRSALASTSEGGDLSITGSGTEQTRTDSYTSADGDGYEASEVDPDGNITVAGSITLKGNSCVEGSIKSGDSVTVKGDTCTGESYKVQGDAFYKSTKDIKNGYVNGEVDTIDDIEGDGSIDSHVDDKFETIDNNTDSDADINADDELVFGADNAATLEAGMYSLDKLVIEDGETLTLDTTDGDILIGVENYTKLSGAAQIAVAGSNQVKIYLKGDTEDSKGYDLHMIKNKGSSPTVAIPNQNSTQLWIYGKSDTQAKLKGSNTDVHFEGVIYAPGGPSGSGTIDISKAEVYGGIVAPDIDISQGGEFHYDRALGERVAVPKDTKVVTITYLHVTVNRVNVTSGG